MQRDLGIKVFNPTDQLTNVIVGIVQSGNKQSNNFYMTPFVKAFYRIKHKINMHTAANFVVKLFIHRFDIYSRRVYPIHLVYGLRRHVTVCDKHIVQPFFVCYLCRIVSVFKEYCRFCVCVSDSLRTVPLGEFNDAFGRDVFTAYFVRLTDLPVLTV